MSRNIYFISDVHLSFKEDAAEIRKREKLLAFLEHIQGRQTELYILGDLFDFWFEWYHVVPRYWFPVLYQLRKMVDRGTAVHLVTGNHDFYTGQYLEKEIGVICHKEYRELRVDSKVFFLAHGDGYAQKDWGYRLLKKIIRNPVSIFLYKTFLSADLGAQMAKWASGSSRKLKKIDLSAWSEEYYRFAEKKFREGFDYVILGHIHCPMRREENGRVYVNCGDWIAHFSYARYDGQNLSLHHWQA